MATLVQTQHAQRRWQQRDKPVKAAQRLCPRMKQQDRRAVAIALLEVAQGDPRGDVSLADDGLLSHLVILGPAETDSC